MAAPQLTPAQSSTPARPTAGADAKSPSADKVAAARKAAQDFEALFLSQMISHMFAGTTDAKGMFGGGAGEEAWRDVLTQEYAKTMAKSGGVGIAKTVMAEMLRQQEAK